MSGAPSILLVNSGSSIKSFTLEKTKEMGLKRIHEPEWQDLLYKYLGS